MPLDLIASEQQRIAGQLAGVEGRLSATSAKFNEIEANLAMALDLVRDCHTAYLAADPQVRRLFNQAFFTHLYIDDDGLRSDYAEPFDTLLVQDVPDAVERSRPTARPARSRWPTSSDGPRPAPTTRPPGHTVPWGSARSGFGTCSLCRRFEYVYFGAPGRIRTCGLAIRSRLLYPAELRGPCQKQGSERRCVACRVPHAPGPERACGPAVTGRSPGRGVHYETSSPAWEFHHW